MRFGNAQDTARKTARRSKRNSPTATVCRSEAELSAAAALVCQSVGSEALTRIGTAFLVPKSTTELPDFDEILARYRRNSEMVRAEDVRAGESQQLDLRSALHVPGRFTPPPIGARLRSVDSRHAIGNAGP